MSGVVRVAQLWRFFKTPRLCITAASGEGTVPRRVHQIGGATSDRPQTRVAGMFDLRNGLKQCFGIGVPHVGEKSLSIGKLDNPSRVHD
ncbi:uncharacterized protein METZ01_LOCUS127232, partial [marine metagenome]